MSQHPSARLTPRGRERMAERVEAGEPVAEVARQVGAGRQTASRWLGRRRRGEPTAGRPSSLQRPPRIQGHRAQVHQAVQPLAERQGRADEPHPRPGVAVRAGPGERGALQLGQAAQRLRGPAAHVAHRRRQQRLGTQQLGNPPCQQSGPPEKIDGPFLVHLKGHRIDWWHPVVPATAGAEARCRESRQSR